MAADSFLTVKARLARALLELTEYLGEDAGAGRVLIRHKITQSDLAAIAGVARENVSRVLSDWKRRDLVTRSSGFYCLTSDTDMESNLSHRKRRLTITKLRWEWIMAAMRCETLRSRVAHIVQLRPIRVSQDAHDFSKYRPHPPNPHLMFLSSLRLVRTGAATPVL